MNNNEVRISVRSLVEFVLRTGSLGGGFVTNNRALEGTRLHKKIQKSKNSDYKAEVTISHKIQFEDLNFVIEGRVDGIFCEDDNIVIDEIKTTTKPIEYIDEEYNHLHWAQAKCYGFIYCEQNNLEKIIIQLTYCELDTEEIKYLRKIFLKCELETFVNELIKKYYVWAKLSLEWSTERDISIKNLEFPFEKYRKGQRELAVASYKTIQQEKKLFVQAPTGIGKTVSTIFPSIKAIGEGLASKIFYLTAKTITRQVAEDAFKKMNCKGLRFKTITLIAKEKICFKSECNCNPEVCEFSNGHFDRVNEAIYDIITNVIELNREVIEEYAEKYKVCPFEFSLDLSLWSDCIICDYNYVFDPRVYLKRFFMNNSNDYIFLIDEAHNLVNRAREMFSAEIYKSQVLDVKKLMKDKDKKIHKIIGKINSFFIKLKNECDNRLFLAKHSEPEELYPLLKQFVKESEEWLAKNEGSDGHNELMDLYFNVISFLKISELYDEKYLFYIEIINNEVKIKLMCIDPSFLLCESVKRGKTAIFFSATLTPLNYFREILGGNECDYLMKLKSPYSEKNLCLLVANNISTKYKNRSNSYDKIVHCIEASVKQKIGNYLVFFPSYKYMNEIASRFIERNSEVSCILQTGDMSEEDRVEFLNKFSSSCKKSLVGFGVLGGIFSEGIDLSGDKLIGAIIVGVGLPQINKEEDLIMGHFEKRNGMGYEYAYMYPGMNKVLQASGRVIRTEKDRGFVLLIDERFTYFNYQRLFPNEWSHYKTVKNADELNDKIYKFWNRK